jgi:hypothetical protein
MKKRTIKDESAIVSRTVSYKLLCISSSCWLTDQHLSINTSHHKRFNVWVRYLAVSASTHTGGSNTITNQGKLAHNLAMVPPHQLLLRAIILYCNNGKLAFYDNVHAMAFVALQYAMTNHVNPAKKYYMRNTQQHGSPEHRCNHLSKTAASDSWKQGNAHQFPRHLRNKLERLSQHERWCNTKGSALPANHEPG